MRPKTWITGMFFSRKHIFLVMNSFIHLNYLTQIKHKRPSHFNDGLLCLTAGRGGFEPPTGFKAGTHLAGEPIQPLWHLPNFNQRYNFTPSANGNHKLC